MHSNDVLLEYKLHNCVRHIQLACRDGSWAVKCVHKFPKIYSFACGCVSSFMQRPVHPSFGRVKPVVDG